MLIDITLPLTGESPVYPGDQPFSRTVTSSMEDGASSNNSVIKMGVHCGTHIDAPRHFMSEGRTIEALSPDLFIGKCKVLDLTFVESIIDVSVLQSVDLGGCTRLLLKTSNAHLLQQGRFCTDYVALSKCGAQYLVEKGVKLIGIDYYSIAPFTEPEGVHRLILANDDMAILEAVDLSTVTPGEYELLCLPLLIPGADAAPVRAFLRSVGSCR